MNSGCSVCTLAPLVARRYPWNTALLPQVSGLLLKGIVLPTDFVMKITQRQNVYQPYNAP